MNCEPVNLTKQHFPLLSSSQSDAAIAEENDDRPAAEILHHRSAEASALVITAYCMSLAAAPALFQFLLFELK